MAGLRITTWNVNGIRNPFSYHPWNDKRTYEAMFDHLEADIVILQEIRIQPKDLRDEMVLVPGWDCFFSFPTHKKGYPISDPPSHTLYYTSNTHHSGYSGVVIYTRNATCCPIRAEEGITGILTPPNSIRSFRDLPQDDQIGGYPTEDQVRDSEVDCAATDSEGRCVILEFPAFVLIGTYCPADRDQSRDNFRLSFLTMVDARIRNLDAMGKRVVWAGDINVGRAARDIATVEEAIRCQHMALQDFHAQPARRLLNQLLVGGIVFGDRDPDREKPIMWDLCRGFHLERTGMFTCWNTKTNSRPGNHGARLDYIFCSDTMKGWFHTANIQPTLKGSDHCPVNADSKDRVDINSKFFPIRDLMNPPGMFVDGVRRREWSVQDLLPTSGKMIGEFIRRRNIKHMFSRKLPIPVGKSFCAWSSTTSFESQLSEASAEETDSQPPAVETNQPPSSQPSAVETNHPPSSQLPAVETDHLPSSQLPAVETDHPPSSQPPAVETDHPPGASTVKRAQKPDPAVPGAKRTKSSTQTATARTSSKKQQSLREFLIPKPNYKPTASSLQEFLRQNASPSSPKPIARSLREFLRPKATPSSLQPTPRDFLTPKPTPYSLQPPTRDSLTPKPTPYSLQPPPSSLQPIPSSLQPTPSSLQPTPRDSLTPKHNLQPTPSCLQPTLSSLDGAEDAKDEQRRDEQQTDEQRRDEKRRDEQQTDEQRRDEKRRDEQQTDEQRRDEKRRDEQQTDEQRGDEKRRDVTADPADPALMADYIELLDHIATLYGDIMEEQKTANGLHGDVMEEENTANDSPSQFMETSVAMIDPKYSKTSWCDLFIKPVPPKCEHRQPCKIMLTKKPGKNCGRAFWMCKRPLGPSGAKEKRTVWQCGTFLWASDWSGGDGRAGYSHTDTQPPM